MINYESMAYFTSRLMYWLNKYTIKRNKYYEKSEKELFRGVKMIYSDLLPYERAKGKIILLSGFISTNQDESLALKLAGRDITQSLYKTNLKFSVDFIIRNLYNKNWISNGIDISKESKYENDKEILYQPFSFYYVRDVQIDHKKYIWLIFI